MAQDMMQQWGNEYKGVILSGSNGHVPIPLLKVGKVLAKRDEKKLGMAPSKKMDNQTFKSYNRQWKKEPGATAYEWLSRDKEEVKKYIDDPWCGFVSPARLYYEILVGLLKIWNEENEKKIPKDLPIYVFSGTEDPVSSKTKNLKLLLERYRDYGIQEVAVKFYQDGRHESFNEINRDEVFSDLIKWLNEHV